MAVRAGTNQNVPKFRFVYAQREHDKVEEVVTRLLELADGEWLLDHFFVKK